MKQSTLLFIFVCALSTSLRSQITISTVGFPAENVGGTTYQRLPNGVNGVAYANINFDITDPNQSGITWSTNEIDPPGSVSTFNANDGIVSISATTGTVTFRLTAVRGVDSDFKDFIVDFLIPAKPIDLVLVLDQSGSMNATDVDNNGAAISRWTSLKNSVSSALGIIPPLNRSTTDRIAIDYFGNALPDPLPSPSVGFSAFQNFAAGTPALVNLELNGRAIGGWTAMGLGMQAGLSRLPAASDASRKRMILLFTDGEQNRDPHVNNAGNVYEFKLGPGAPGNIFKAGNDIKVFATGIAIPNPMYNAALQGLANSSNGKFFIVPSTSPGGVNAAPAGAFLFSDMASGFLNEFTEMLNDASPQIVKIKNGFIINNDDFTVEQFILNKQVSNLLLRITFGTETEANNMRNVLRSYFVIERDGVNMSNFFTPIVYGASSQIGMAASTGRMTNYGILALNFDSLKQKSEGNWVVKFVWPKANIRAINTEVIKAQQQRGRVRFTLDVIADDHRIDYNYGYDNKKVIKVGSPLNFTVKLSRLGVPIKNADISVIVARPGADLGDLLAKHQLKVPNSDKQDAHTAGTLKYFQLLKTDTSFVAKLKPNENTVKLNDTGTGQYTGSFTGTTESGVYQLLYLIKGTSPHTGAFERIAMESVYVRFADVDPAKSSITKTVSGNIITVTITPVGINGKFVGPAAEDAFKFTSGGKSKLTKVIDNQDGSYTFTFEGDPSDNISLDLLDQKLFTGKLENIDKAGQAGNVLDKLNSWLESIGLPRWAIWAILALVALMIIWLALRKKKA